jgi:hypothetical protein
MRNTNVVDKIDRRQLSQGGWCFSCGKHVTQSEIHAVIDTGLYLHFFCRECWEEGSLSRKNKR